MGDLILSFPVVEALKLSLPEARIDMFVNPATAPLAKLQRHISSVIPNEYPGPKGFFELVRSLKARKYDLAIHLYARPVFAFAASLARIPVRAGTRYRYYAFCFNRRIKIHRKFQTEHERDLNLKLIEGLGIHTKNISSGIAVPETARADISALLLSRGITPDTRPFVVLHPGSGGSSLNWPPAHYGTLGEKLLSLGFPVVLTGTERDRPAVDHVNLHTGHRVTDLSEKLTLVQLSALLSQASLVISNSTGPLHLADALGTKVIGLYSPFLYSSPVRWGPYGQPGNVLLPPERHCTRCTKDRCQAYNCMSSIQPERVLEKAKELLFSES